MWHFWGPLTSQHISVHCPLMSQHISVHCPLMSQHISLHWPILARQISLTWTFQSFHSALSFDVIAYISALSFAWQNAAVHVQHNWLWSYVDRHESCHEHSHLHLLSLLCKWNHWSVYVTTRLVFTVVTPHLVLISKVWGFSVSISLLIVVFYFCLDTETSFQYYPRLTLNSSFLL